MIAFNPAGSHTLIIVKMASFFSLFLLTLAAFLLLHKKNEKYKSTITWKRLIANSGSGIQTLYKFE